METETTIVRLRPETLARVREKAGTGCFLCRRILEAADPQGTLRDWPRGREEAEFPVEAQKYHIQGNVH